MYLGEVSNEWKGEIKMKFLTWEEAKKQAQANADYFGKPFCVFQSTSGEVYVERYYPEMEFEKKIFWPSPEQQPNK